MTKANSIKCPDKWDCVSVASLGRIVSGGTPSRTVRHFWNGTIPWVTPTEITALRDKWLAATKERITDAGLSGSAAKLLPNGSVVITTRATLGARAITQVALTTNQGFKSIVPNEETDSLWCYYAVELLQREMERRAVGTTFLEISKSDFETIPLCRPLKPEQVCIAKILDMLDGLIRETKDVVAKLRQVKAGLLHELLTRGLDEQGQLRDHCRHPEQFKDSPLGRIPNAWEVAFLGNFLRDKPRNGHSPLEATAFEGGYMLGLGCLTRNGYRPIQLKNAPMKDPCLARCLLRPGDILISRSNTRELVAAVGCFPGSSIPIFYPDLMMRLTPTDQVKPEYLELILRHPKVRSQLTNRASGTSGSMVKITSKAVVHAYVSIPKSEEQREILRVADRYSAGIQSEERILDKLRCLKRGLSHDLLTGGVRVKLRS